MTLKNQAASTKYRNQGGIGSMTYFDTALEAQVYALTKPDSTPGSAGKINATSVSTQHSKPATRNGKSRRAFRNESSEQYENTGVDGS